MNVLVVGSGGREHALVWALSRSAAKPTLLAAPGNAGMRGLAEILPIQARELEALVQVASERQIGLVVIGPEEPLALGLADALRQAGIAVFGVGGKAARLESSKAFAKDFMRRHGIPTARYRVAETPGDAAMALAALGPRVAVKADGLAQGKGVVLCSTMEEAEAAVERLMVRKERGEAGATLVIEERLEGTECTVMALCDGTTLLPLPVSRDHKRLLDADRGPNTGGMGAIAPVDLPEQTLSRIERDILVPFLNGLQKDGLAYRGAIYFGLMLTDQGPCVLEFNVRFGDPEAQAVLPILKDDFLELSLATAQGQLAGRQVHWNGEYSCCVVLACAGYPQGPSPAVPIAGLEEASREALLFHAGTELREGSWIASGGRIISATGVAPHPADARLRAYRAASCIRFEGKQMRTDIGTTGMRAKGQGTRETEFEIAAEQTVSKVDNNGGQAAESHPSSLIPHPSSLAPKVWIFMGSESDRPVMAQAAETLAQFGVESRLAVASAHRSPDYLMRLLEQSEPEAALYIAGAGGAAHLAGVIASHTVRPVIGVPIGTKLGGLDSLLSTVQMPKGVPVATVAVDGAHNAALLAVEILALFHQDLREKLQEFRRRQAQEIETKGRTSNPTLAMQDRLR